MKGLLRGGEARGSSRGSRSSLEKSKQLVKPQPRGPGCWGVRRQRRWERERRREPRDTPRQRETEIPQDRDRNSGPQKQRYLELEADGTTKTSVSKPCRPVGLKEAWSPISGEMVAEVGPSRAHFAHAHTRREKCVDGWGQSDSWTDGGRNSGGPGRLQLPGPTSARHSPSPSRPSGLSMPLCGLARVCVCRGGFTCVCGLVVAVCVGTTRASLAL